MTNKEYIESLSIDELIIVFRGFGDDRCACCAFREMKPCNKNCDDGFRKWLHEDSKEYFGE